MKQVTNILTAFTMGLLMLACTPEVEPGQGTVALSVRASGSNTLGSSSARLAGTEEVIITDFQIAIRDVAFKAEEDASDTNSVNFRGPYQLDLLNGSDALSQSIGEQLVPNGMYKEVRFELHKDRDVDAAHPLYDRSIYLKGTINGTPFEMWHDTSENLDVGRSTGVEVKGNKVELVVNFTLEQFLNSEHTIDLTQAKDGNGDGLIEINTNDEDGNKELADLLKDNIKLAADLMDK